MRILIAGAGTIGTNLAAALVREGQDVVVIDSDPAKLAGISEALDCQTIAGNATSPMLLEEAGIRAVDLLVAVTASDETNMAVCRLAEHYQVPRKLARLRNPEYIDPECPVPPAHFGIDQVFSPEGITVGIIERIVACPGATEAVDFEQGRIALRALQVSEDGAVAGRSLAELRAELSGRFVVAAIRRAGRVIIPDGQERLRLGDHAYVVCAPDELPDLCRRFDRSRRAARSAILYGAGVLGVSLARSLRARLDRVTLIEPDAVVARRAAEVLDPLGVVVLEGSALDRSLLLRAGAESADVFAAISDDDENNLMSSLLFRTCGGGTPIVLAGKEHYLGILEMLDLPIVLNPRLLAVSTILRYLRGGLLLSVAKLHSDEVEVQELRAGQGARITTAMLKELALPRGMVMAAVLRGKELHLPGGDFRIKADDRVLVVLDRRQVAACQALFSGAQS